MLPLCRAEGIGVIPWSPLARGRLTRDWDETSARSETDEFGKTLYAARPMPTARWWRPWPRLPPQRGVPRAQVALAWLLGQARHHRADRRRDQAAAPGRRGGGTVGRADGGRNQGSGSPLHPACGDRILVKPAAEGW